MKLDQYDIVSMHKSRRKARAMESALTDALERRQRTRAPIEVGPDSWYTLTTDDGLHMRVPVYVRGFKVKRAGLLQHAVIATTNVGH